MTTWALYQSMVRCCLMDNCQTVNGNNSTSVITFVQLLFLPQRSVHQSGFCDSPICRTKCILTFTDNEEYCQKVHLREWSFDRDIHVGMSDKNLALPPLLFMYLGCWFFWLCFLFVFFFYWDYDIQNMEKIQACCLTPKHLFVWGILIY